MDYHPGPTFVPAGAALINLGLSSAVDIVFPRFMNGSGKQRALKKENRFEFRGVSDLNTGELRDFVRLIKPYGPGSLYVSSTPSLGRAVCACPQTIPRNESATADLYYSETQGIGPLMA
jgi:hypothetical protein